MPVEGTALSFVLDLVKAMLPALVVGIIMAHYNKKQNERDKKNDQREAERIKGERVRLDLLVAGADLSYACAMALKRGHANGEVEEGVKSYDKAMDAFHAFERDQITRINGNGG